MYLHPYFGRIRFEGSRDGIGNLETEDGMRIRKLVLTLTGVTMLLGGLVGVGVAQATAAQASSLCTGQAAGLLQLQNGNYATDISGIWNTGTQSQATTVCLFYQYKTSLGEAYRFESMNSDEDLTGFCITWDKSTGDIYDSACGQYPASQDWETGPSPQGAEWENVYAGECLAGSPDSGNHQLYVYSCAPGGNDANQNWFVIP
jgi:hypothetical protein